MKIPIDCNIRVPDKKQNYSSTVSKAIAHLQQKKSSTEFQPINSFRKILIKTKTETLQKPIAKRFIKP